VLNGLCTAIAVLAGGAGYLFGGSTESATSDPDEGQLVEMGIDFLGYVTTDASGAVVSCTTVDGGGHFVAPPLFAFANGVAWTTPPVLTAHLGTSNTAGVSLRACYGAQFADAHLESGQYGLVLWPDVIGTEIYGSQIAGGVAPIWDQTLGGSGLGIRRVANLTLIDPSGASTSTSFVEAVTIGGGAQVIDLSNCAWGPERILVKVTASAPATISNITGLISSANSLLTLYVTESSQPVQIALNTPPFHLSNTAAPAGFPGYPRSSISLNYMPENASYKWIETGRSWRTN